MITMYSTLPTIISLDLHRSIRPSSVHPYPLLYRSKWVAAMLYQTFHMKISQQADYVIVRLNKS